jgi:hypothetical protein
MSRFVVRGAFVALVVALAAGAWKGTEAQQAGVAAVAIDPDDIGGLVRSAKGPEAGVWVIAETSDLPTKFRKIVVTDDQGRYLLPDLPKAGYRIWVRGYGLVDSAPVNGSPGQQLNLSAALAHSAHAAAEVYPANYWYSLAEVPPKSDFPGTGPQGNGIPPGMQTQAAWISNMKTGCELCHQMGTKATREIPKALGVFDSTAAAWRRRVTVGQDGGFMGGSFARFGPRGVAVFSDWTDRIAAGALPPVPPRPQGIERNVVLTLWDWGSPNSFVHDEITTDKRNPTVNANGPLYGLDYTNDKLLLVDPVTNAASTVDLPVRDPKAAPSKPQKMPAPSPYWGSEIYWSGRAAAHSAMIDTAGRVWMTTQIDRTSLPEFCHKSGMPGLGGSSSETGSALRGGSVALVYDPQSKGVDAIDTCYSTHHLQFAADRDDTLYFSGDANVVGWIKTKVWDQTRDMVKSQGFCPTILDYNGDGVIGKYTEPNEPPDPRLDRRISGSSYGIIPNPVDGSVWYATSGPMPGRIVRIDIGSNPPATCKAELYEPPFNIPGVVSGYTPKGIDVDRRTGVIWTGLSGSGHLASFDRRKCKVLNGPKATGQHCAEGWTLYLTPGPKFRGVTDDANVDHLYYNWVDQFDALGLGENVPLANGTGSDSLLALRPNGEWLVMRVPYPMGFYSRSISGRIDNPRGGWKGRGVYADYGPNNLWHTEGGKGTLSAMVKFQIRPDPLAK